MTDNIAPDLVALAAPVKKLRHLDRNPRRSDVEAVARSYERFGQRKPIVARRDGTVIAGNHQLAAARKLGWTKIAVVWVDDDDDTATAYALADNRLGDLGTYDERLLAELLAEIAAADADLLDVTGYDRVDLDDLVLRLAPPSLDRLANDYDPTNDAPHDLPVTIKIKVSADVARRWAELVEGSDPATVFANLIPQ